MDRLKALLDVLDEPPCFLQLAHQIAVTTPLPAQNLGVQTIDTQPWVGIRVDVSRPLALELPDDDIGSDIACLQLREARPRSRIKADDQRMGILQRLLGAFGKAPDLRKIASSQQFKMLLDNQQGQLLVG